jgi:hypothetical protein
MHGETPGERQRGRARACAFVRTQVRCLGEEVAGGLFVREHREREPRARRRVARRVLRVCMRMHAATMHGMRVRVVAAARNACGSGEVRAERGGRELVCGARGGEPVARERAQAHADPLPGLRGAPERRKGNATQGAYTCTRHPKMR